jgi:hypothetical protein
MPNSPERSGGSVLDEIACRIRNADDNRDGCRAAENPEGQMPCRPVSGDAATKPYFALPKSAIPWKNRREHGFWVKRQRWRQGKQG